MLNLLKKDKKKKSLTAQVHLEEVKKWLEKEHQNLLDAIGKACREVDEEKATYSLRWLLKIGELRKICDSLPLQKEKKTPLYVVSSWFLHNCYLYLTQKPVESLHYVTGISFNGIYVLDHLIQVEMSHQSVASARADSFSSHKALCKMDEYGHLLLAHFHSHPGEGPGATHPSGIDLNYQRSLDQGGYKAVGGIFSRDGFVRFFPEGKDFNINVFGKEVEKIGKRVFRITKMDSLRSRGDTG